MILTKELKKYIKSLQYVKFRQKYNKFIAEGPKICEEIMLSGRFIIDYIACTETYLLESSGKLGTYAGKTIICNDTDLKSISGLKNPNKILIVANQDEPIEELPDFKEAWGIYCDRIQDPGNMGTILRIADWFGIKWVLASKDSVDFYNPKLIQAGMGAHNRIRFQNLSRKDFIESYSEIALALCLDGENLKSQTAAIKNGLIVVGNESQGISPLILERAGRKLKIENKGGAESLNASVACGIACYSLII